MDQNEFGYKVDHQNKFLIPQSMSPGTPYVLEYIPKLIRRSCHPWDLVGVAAVVVQTASY